MKLSEENIEKLSEILESAGIYDHDEVSLCVDGCLYYEDILKAADFIRECMRG